jgi:hypothetical protein
MGLELSGKTTQKISHVAGLRRGSAFSTLPHANGGIVYCTTTVMVVLWFKLPEEAVMVAVYVPAGVPGVVVVCEEADDPPPPPQPITDMPAKAMTATAISNVRLRFHGSSVPNRTAAQATGAPPKEDRD